MVPHLGGDWVVPGFAPSLIAIKFRSFSVMASSGLLHNIATTEEHGWMMPEEFTSPRAIALLNIEHYCSLLRTSLDDRTRTTVENLLAEEQAKLARLEGDQHGPGDARHFKHAKCDGPPNEQS